MLAIEAIIALRDDMSAQLKTIDKNLVKFSKKTRRFGKSLRKTGQEVGYLGKDLLKLTSPMIAVSTWSLKLYKDFEAMTSEVQAVLGITDKEAMQPFVKRAREIGEMTSKSASEAMAAMKLLAQAGLSQNEVLETSYKLVRLAEAGNLDMAVAAGLLTNSMNSAGISLEYVDEYLDKIAKTANISDVQMDSLMTSWQEAGGSIESANMTMSETNALLGVLGNRGIKGAKAGVAVSRVFQNMEAISGASRKAMDKLNISTADSNGSLRNKIDVLRELKSKLENYTEAEKNTFLTMIGGKEHVESLKKMLSGLGDEFDDMVNSLENSKGALETMATVMKDNMQGQIDTFNSKMEELGLTIGESLSPLAKEYLEKINQRIEEFTNKLKNMDPEKIREFAQIVIKIIKLSAGLIVFGTTLSWVGGILSNIFTLAKFIKPFLALITAHPLIAPLILLGIVLYKNKEAVIEWAMGVKEKFLSVAGFIKEKISSIVSSIKELWADTTAILKNPIKGTIEVVKKRAAKKAKVQEKIGKNYLGTSNWQGGLTTLHERGPEIYDLPEGTRVYPHQESLNIAREEGKRDSSKNINIGSLAETLIVREEADIQKIVDLLVSKLEGAALNMV